MPSSQRHFDATDEIVAYRGVSGLAVLGLIAGLLSPLAMLQFSFWVIPPIALVLNLLALRQIHARAPELIGRKAAAVGLFLAVACAFAAAVDYAVYTRLVGQEARQFAGQWFEAVRRGECHKVHQMTVIPKSRKPLDDNLWDYYRANAALRKQLQTFVGQQAVRTLLALGPAAEIRFFETVAEGAQEDSDFVQQTYAVTYDDEQGYKKTFFVGLRMIRSLVVGGHAAWQLAGVEGGVRPTGW